MHTQGVTVKSTLSPPPEFVGISDRDMTEIELHSVDSISDLHHTHTEQHSKGFRPPRPQPPSINGNLQMINKPVVYQTGHQKKRSHLSPQNNMCSARWHYSLVCLALILILLILVVIFIFLVQQSAALQRLTDTLKQRQETTEKPSRLIQELQTVHRNPTVSRSG